MNGISAVRTSRSDQNFPEFMPVHLGIIIDVGIAAKRTSQARPKSFLQVALRSKSKRERIEINVDVEHEKVHHGNKHQYQVKNKLLFIFIHRIAPNGQLIIFFHNYSVENTVRAKKFCSDCFSYCFFSL